MRPVPSFLVSVLPLIRFSDSSAGSRLAVLGASATLAGLAVGSAHAGGLFETAVEHPAGDLPMDVAAGDLDGDGFPDVVTANVFSEDVSVFYSAGGELQPQVRIPLGDACRQVEIGDVNGDGFADLLVGREQAAPTLAIAFGDGVGGLEAPVPVGTFDRFVDGLAITDVDLDGDPDIILGSVTSGWIVVYRNDGTGQFDEVAYPLDTEPAYPSDLAVADLDGDGDPDVAVSASLSSHPPVYLLNAGDGTFDEGVPYNPVVAMIVSVAVGDMDGDEDADLVALDFGQDRLLVHPNDGAAGFGPGIAYGIGTSTQPGGKVRLGDLDQDGSLDAVVAPVLSLPVVPVLLGSPDGGLGVPTHYDVGLGPSALEMVDLDLDTDLDIVVTSREGDSIWVLRNNSASPAAVPADAGPRARLSFASPNPFQDATRIGFALDQPSFVRLVVFDAAGRKVRTLFEGNRGPGNHDVRWNGAASSGRPVSPGVYFYRLFVDDAEASVTGRLQRVR